MSGLKRAVEAAVKVSLNTVREFMVDVDWTFVSSDPGSYNPTTDSYSKSEVTISDLSVLIWEDKDDDTQVMFSSRGNFVETPAQLDSLRVLVEAASIPGCRPSTRDTFLWEGEKFGIDMLERIPGDSVFIMKASRV